MTGSYLQFLVPWSSIKTLHLCLLSSVKVADVLSVKPQNKLLCLFFLGWFIHNHQVTPHPPVGSIVCVYWGVYIFAVTLCFQSCRSRKCLLLTYLYFLRHYYSLAMGVPSTVDETMLTVVQCTHYVASPNQSSMQPFCSVFWLYHWTFSHWHIQGSLGEELHDNWHYWFTYTRVQELAV